MERGGRSASGGGGDVGEVVTVAVEKVVGVGGIEIKIFYGYILHIKRLKRPM